MKILSFLIILVIGFLTGPALVTDSNEFDLQASCLQIEYSEEGELIYLFSGECYDIPGTTECSCGFIDCTGGPGGTDNEEACWDEFMECVGD